MKRERFYTSSLSKMIMKYAKIGRILSDLKKAGRPAFRTREFASLVGNKQYAWLVLHRASKKGEIKLVKRGWWAFTDAMIVDIACQISWPCYLSFFSALAIHGLTTQIPKVAQVAVYRNAKRYEINGETVKEYKIKSEFKGFKKMDGMPVATAEKAFADCLDVPRSCPISVMIEALPSVNLEKVRQLCTKQGEKRLREVIRHVK